MEDVVSALREASLDTPVPLELPNDEDILEAEKQLLLPIPFEFREFLLEVSDVVFGALEPVTVSDANLHTYLPEVAATAWDRGLPRDLLPLCEYIGGCYCISAGGEVAFWQDGEFGEETWDSVWHWAKAIWLAQ